MATGIRVEDRLDGQSNFRSWRSRLIVILENNDILNYAKDVVPKPTALERIWGKKMGLLRDVLQKYEIY